MGQYARINIANNARTELDSSITDTDTSISVLDASVFADAPIQLTLVDSNGNLEIVEVGNVDEENDNLEDVSRGVDGTNAQAWDNGDKVEDRFNRGTYDELVGEEGFEGHDNTVHSENFITIDEDVEDFSTQGAADTVPVSQGDGTLQMQELDDEGGFTATQSLIELGVDEMIQISRFVAPADTKIQVFGGSVSDENGENISEETEVELFNHSTGETLFVIDETVLQQGEPLFEDTVGDDELEFRLVNASSETKNLSGKMLFDILEV